ncbi:polysaccharide lyase family 8 protein [Crucibulum laeve]|uniref:Polysaccharide lyase family 8 protein n=1 Tax=Crucibulum laeve TaxID=68775 RepID=A0A5C3M710_9AGAR|nr:polysaccharide lyase family 8 protein [Crucibulum laeve]
MKVFLAFLCACFLHTPFNSRSAISTVAAQSSGKNVQSQSPILTPTGSLVSNTGGSSLVSAPSSTHLIVSSVTPVNSTSSVTTQHSTPSITSSARATSAASANTTTTSASATSSIAQPTQTIDPGTLEAIQMIHQRRLSAIIGALSDPDDIAAWLASLGANGKWPDSEVDYTTGCAARRANWPAQEHWQRILVMSGAWHGGLEGADQYVKDPTIHDAISRAMNYWFSRDFTNLACLDSGGTTRCPCDNTDNSLWNTNWFSNIILIPELVGQSCLLLNDTLTTVQHSNCTHITGRSYGTFDQNINGVGFLTGANTLDVAKIGIDQALLNVNASMLTDAYRRVHLELTIAEEVKADGIRPDGSFGQHGGILYNGNYGKDFTNDILDLEIEAGGTQFSANAASQNAFATLFDGDKWMIYRNSLTGVLHWDFSVLGRFISFPVIDNQATGSIKINLTEVGELGDQWSSNVLTNFADSLSEDMSNANAGKLEGNRMFYANDYMVHRGKNYVSTMKMFSSRTKNTECTNSQNPLGFHLADGVLYTYLRGDEYEDISVAWDWNLIPGTTVDYGATPLTCDHTQFSGIESFVGGASDGEVGLAAMRYTNPFTQTLHWQKVWFFLEDDVQHVMIANISSTTNSSVFSVLDQKRHNGPVVIDGLERKMSSLTSTAQSLWHGDVGYTFPNSNGAFTLSVQVGEKSGNWSTIGTSTQPPATVDLFAAWLEHKSLTTPISYTVFPGTTLNSFAQKSNQLDLQSIRNDGDVSAIFHGNQNTVMIVFWNSAGGTVTFVPSAKAAPITIAANGNIAFIYKMDDGDVIASDPSQALAAVEVTMTLGLGRKPRGWGPGRSKSMVFEFPSGGLAGSSVTQSI